MAVGDFADTVCIRKKRWEISKRCQTWRSSDISGKDREMYDVNIEVWWITRDLREIKRECLSFSVSPSLEYLHVLMRFFRSNHRSKSSIIIGISLDWLSKDYVFQNISGLSAWIFAQCQDRHKIVSGVNQLQPY